MKLSPQRGLVLLFALGLVCAAALIAAGPIPQPQRYHLFADGRSFGGVPNFANVISNLPFLAVGFAGMLFVLGRRTGFGHPGERWPYFFFFVGVFLTCFGSGYYHWRPTDSTLVWDRLPMTLAFAALLAVFLNERISPLLGTRILVPLLGVAAASVAYWRWSGDLRPYVFVQFFPLLAAPLMLVFLPSRYTRSIGFWHMIGWYGLAKLFELLDRQIFNVDGAISGHTLKHLAAAMSCYALLQMLRSREPAAEWRRAAAAAS